MGQMEMKCILNIGKNISTLAKATQVSDVAHGPLVLVCLLFGGGFFFFFLVVCFVLFLMLFEL
jgi:hypothetical protein